MAMEKNGLGVIHRNTVRQHNQFSGRKVIYLQVGLTEKRSASSTKAITKQPCQKHTIERYMQIKRSLYAFQLILSGTWRRVFISSLVGATRPARRNSSG